ncbi:MAG: radical SAM protein [Armatimonadetes bacterium]|nr:radical SAM protein [Armatimonadota bacterium]
MQFSLYPGTGRCIECQQQCNGEGGKFIHLPIFSPKLMEEKEFRILLEDKAKPKKLTWLDERRVLDAIAENVEKTAETLPPISHMELMISEDCNLRCDYCFIYEKNPSNMPLDIAFRAVDLLLAESKHTQDIGILFFGGEPMLGFAAIQSIIEYSNQKALELQKNITYSMTTNGTLFDEERVAYLKKHGCTPLLSLDGPKEIHDMHRKTKDRQGSFDQVINNLPTLLKYFSTIQVRITPHPDTVDKLYESFCFLLGQGLRNFIIGPAHGIKWSSERYGIFFEQMARIFDLQRQIEFQKDPIILSNFHPRFNQGWGCRAGFGYIAIAADGNIYPCSYFIGQRELRDRTCIGNVRDGIDRPTVRAEFILINQQRLSQCQECNLHNICSGGCPGVNFTLTNSLVTASEVTCQEIQTFIRLWSYPIVYFVSGQRIEFAARALAIVDELYKLYPGIDVQFVSYGKGVEGLNGERAKVIGVNIAQKHNFFEIMKDVANIIHQQRPFLAICDSEFAPLPAFKFFGIPTIFIANWFSGADDFTMQTLSYADTILFDGSKELFKIPEYLINKVKYINRLHRNFAYFKDDRERARDELELDPQATIISVFPEIWNEKIVPSFELVMSAFDQLPKGHQLLLWVTSGENEIVHSTNKSVVFRQSDKLNEHLIVASDLVISKCDYMLMRDLEALNIPAIILTSGFNTIGELYANNTPNFLSLSLRTLTTDMLLKTIQNVLERPKVYPSNPSNHLEGITQAAHAIASLLPKFEN